MSVSCSYVNYNQVASTNSSVNATSMRKSGTSALKYETAEDKVENVCTEVVLWYYNNIDASGTWFENEPLDKEENDTWDKIGQTFRSEGKLYCYNKADNVETFCKVNNSYQDFWNNYGDLCNYFPPINMVGHFFRRFRYLWLYIIRYGDKCVTQSLSFSISPITLCILYYLYARRRPDINR